MKIFIYLTLLILCNVTTYADEDYDDVTNKVGDEDGADKEETLRAKLELIDMDLVDFCEDMAINLHKSLLETPVNFSEKILNENSYGNYLKSQREELNVGEVSYEFQRNLSLINQSGDWLLPENILLKLLNYYNTFEESHYNVEELDGIGSKNLSKQDYLDVLSTSRNRTQLQNLWSTWQFALLYGDPYKPILQLVTKAAEINGHYNVEDYWSKLVDIEEAYKRADELWSSIEPFYLKLQTFVLHRLNAHYKTNYTYIPAFLTGTNFGNDWSNIADILMPHPQLLHDIEFKLKGKSNRDAFALAEKLTKEMGLNGLGKEFWSKSNFNVNLCENKINPHCASAYSEVLTCDKLNWQKYLNAHESAMRVVLNNNDYGSLMRMSLRYSPYDDALIGLASLFAIENLPFVDILPIDVFNEDINNYNKMSALLLAALRILPQLPYYLAADKWRLDELENNSANLTASWWEFRMKYQGVRGLNNNEPDFMTDSHFIRNEPYLSKFFGLILQFQLVDYYQVGLFNEGGEAISSFNDETIRLAIRDRPNKAGTDFLSYHFGITDIAADSLLSFFEPLEEYLQTYVDHREPIIQRKPEPSTTTVIPTTTIVATVEPKVVKSVAIEPIEQLHDKNDTSEVTRERKQTDKVINVPNNNSPNEKTNEGNSYMIVIILACVVAASVVVYFIYKYSRNRRKFQRNRRENTDIC